MSTFYRTDHQFRRALSPNPPRTGLRRQDGQALVEVCFCTENGGPARIEGQRSARRVSRYLAPPAARHAHGGSTGLVGKRDVRGRYALLSCDRVPRMRLAAAGPGDRVGRLRGHPPPRLALATAHRGRRDKTRFDAADGSRCARFAVRSWVNGNSCYSKSKTALARTSRRSRRGRA